MKSVLSSFWQARNEREKKVLIFCTLLLLIGFFYAYLWLPGERAIASLQQNLPQLRANVVRMDAQANEIILLRKHLPVADKGADLKNEIDASALHHNLHDSVSALNIDTSGKAHLTLDSIAFNTWINWLDALQRDNHLRLEATHIQALTTPGMVKVDATLASWAAL